MTISNTTDAVAATAMVVKLTLLCFFSSKSPISFGLDFVTTGIMDVDCVCVVLTMTKD